MDKRLFDDAIGEVPPSTVDVDAAIARGRRAARIRTVANPMVGVAATVLLVVGAVAYAILPGDPASPAPPAVTSSPPPAPDGTTRFCSIGEMRPRADEPADAARDRLTALAGRLFEERLTPDAVLSETVSAVDSAGTRYAPLEFWQFYPPGGPEPNVKVPCDHDPFQYTALANVGIGGKFASIYVAVAVHELPTGRCARVPMGKAEPYCEAFTASGGERVLARTEVLHDDSVQHVVWVNKPDGTAVDITLHNRADHGRPGNLPGMRQPPLSVDQLVEIALDPELTLFP